MTLSGGSIASEVQKFLGDPYVYGGAGPTDFDCSGLVQYVLLQLGVRNVPRTSESQWSWVQKIQYSDLQPGDLVFSQWPGDDAPPGHVAVYVGNGDIVEAPSPGQSVHKIALDQGYRNFVTGYGRVPGAAAGGGGGSVPVSTPTGGTQATSLDFGGVLSWLNPLNVTSDIGTIIASVFGPVANAVQDFWKGFNVAMKAVVWLVNPANWVRIIAGIVGTVSLIIGLVFVAKAA